MADFRGEELERLILSEVHPLVVRRIEPLLREVVKQYSRYLAENMEGGFSVGQTSRRGLVSFFEFNQYWAVILHDGRRSIQAPPGKRLVYFPNIEDDPRVLPLVGGIPDYPDDPADIRPLDEEQFKAGMAENVRRGWTPFGTGLTGEGAATPEPFMLAVPSVGPADPLPWFDLPYPAGTVGLAEKVDNDGAVERSITAALRPHLPSGLRVARLRIR